MGSHADLTPQVFIDIDIPRQQVSDPLENCRIPIELCDGFVDECADDYFHAAGITLSSRAR